MSKRYIDADALAKRILGTGIVTKTEETQSLWHALQSGVVEYINRTPIADVVEVVRCKECKYLNGMADCLDFAYFCGLMNIKMPKDGYCYYGKKRDEVEE